MANVQNAYEFWLSNEKLIYLLSNHIRFKVIEKGDDRSKIQIEIVSGMTLSSLIYAGIQYGVDSMSNSYLAITKHSDANEEADIMRDREMNAEHFTNEILQREAAI